MENQRRYHVPTGLITKQEKIAGWVYLPVHLLVIPLLLSVLALRLPYEISDGIANLLYMGFGFAYSLLFLRGFLRRGFDALADRPIGVLLAIANAIAIYWICSILMNIIWGILSERFALDALLTSTENPNDAALSSYMGREAQIIKALAICIAPVVEEVLFRGVLFGEIRKRSRILAYVVSALLFGVFHIWQYALVYREPLLLIYTIQYIPHSIGLAWSYERSNSIWAPIFCHMAMNMLAFSL